MKCYQLITFNLVLFGEVFFGLAYMATKYNRPTYAKYSEQTRVCKHSHDFSLMCAKEEMIWDTTSAPKLNFKEDYYTVLEVPVECSSAELKKKYLKLVFLYHPDKKDGDEAKRLANRQMMVINNAYKILKDPVKRAEYDLKRNRKHQASSTTRTSSQQSNRYQKDVSASRQQNKSKSVSGNAEAVEDFSPPSWGKYTASYESESESSTSGESLVDVLTDLWSEVRRDGGQGLLRDLEEFLDEQVPGTEINGQQQSVSELETEIAIKSAASQHLKAHLKDLNVQKTAIEATLLWQQMSNTGSRSSSNAESKEKSLDQLKQRFQTLESRKVILASMKETESQIYKLEQEIQKAEKKKLRQSTKNSSRSDQIEDKFTSHTNNYDKKSSSSSSTKSSVSSQTYQSTTSSTSSRDDAASKALKDLAVEDELLKLKRKMGLL